MVFYEETPGLLIHPLWQASQAYFVSLQVQQTPQPDYVRYSFAFWEERSAETVKTETAGKSHVHFLRIQGKSRFPEGIKLEDRALKYLRLKWLRASSLKKRIPSVFESSGQKAVQEL